MSENGNREPHHEIQHDIWSVPAGKLRWYITLLIISGSVLAGYLIAGEPGNPDHSTNQELAKAIAADVLLSYTAAALGSFVIIQGVEQVMVVTHFFREQTRKLVEQRLERERLERERREQARAEGRAAGRAEGWSEWAAWNERRIEAERNGLPFDEAPPSPGDAG